MKKLLLLAIGAISIPTYALPTYEPFTEYYNLVSASGSNAVDLAAGGFTVTNGAVVEKWGELNFYGTGAARSNAFVPAAFDVVVTNFTSTVFTSSALAGLLPGGFPGLTGTNLQLCAYIPTNNPASNVVGNSAVLQFSQDIPRPSSGVKTIYVSYLLDITVAGQTGGGNNGRYCAFLSQTNLVEPPAAGTGAYQTWNSMFNTFGAGGTNTPTYVSYGVKTGFSGGDYLLASDSFGGNVPSLELSTVGTAYNKAAFVVGAFFFTTGGSIKDTNMIWANPPTNTFGGPTPSTVNAYAYTMTNVVMSDVGGFLLLDRVGVGATGGTGPTYMGNLLLGTTWSYVTGGPEFTNTPANVLSNLGSTVTLSAAAVAAAQTVSYQWQHVTATATNNLTNGLVNPGGTAIVSGATSGQLSLAGISNGDTNGSYRVVAAASGTGFALASSTATVSFDPLITVQPQEVFTTPGGTATFSISATTQFPALTYLWQMSGTNLSDGALPDGSVISGSATSVLTISNASKLENNDLITCGVTNGVGSGEISAAATLITTDPAITSQPQPAQTNVNYGAQVQFTASALTSPANAPLTYAWYDGATMLANGLQADGSTVSGATGTGSGNSLITTLTLSNVGYLDNGSYSLVVTNLTGLVATSAVATLNVTDPIIIAQPPANVEVALGSNTAISISASGTGLSYQWYNTITGLLNNGGDISGVTNSTLVISGAQPADAGTYYVVVTGSNPVNGALTSSNVTVYVDTAVTALTVSPTNLTQQAGTHLALAGVVTGGTGGLLHLSWQLNGAALSDGARTDGSSISGSGTTTLVLTNIHTADSGTYTLTASNAAGQLSAASVLTVSAGLLPLSTNNLVVTRLGEGSEALSGATGNTLYLDQFTTNGGYISTIMVPDTGANTLIIPGAGSDGTNEAYLTLSSNGDYLNFAGYCWSYPYTAGNDVTVGGTPDIRGLGAINGLGYYALAYTNEGLYSGGNHFIRSAYSTDGLTNFWTTGDAGGGTIKYVNAGPLGASYATGSGIPALAGTGVGSRVVGVVGPNLVYSDNGTAGYAGLNAFSGLAENNGAASVNFISFGSPADFAFSPDSNTVYIADDGPAIPGGTSYGGGVQRWDYIGGSYTYEYTLENTTGSGGNGVRGLTVVFPPGITTWGQNVNGAIIYATTAENSANRLITFTDTGTNSTPTVLATAGTNELMQGVRFGPASLPVSILAGPQSTNAFFGQSDTLTVSLAGDAPFFYQWQLDGTNLSGATLSSLALSSLASNNAGTYTVIVSNAISSNSFSAIVNVSNAAPILLVGPQSRVETAGDHLAFAVAATGTLPIKYQWAFDGANISGATASAISLTNIVVTNSGTYSVIYSNQFGASTNAATLLVTTSLQSLSSNNLVVARVGDGVEALSSATGNTVYLDQLTPSGGYSNTIMIPDNAASGNLIVPGGAPEGPLGTVLNLSANNSNFLNFAGFSATYPNPVKTNFLEEVVPRAMGAVNAFGYYEEPMTPLTLYDSAGAGADLLNSAVSLDGYAEFWTTGEAGSPPAVKYVIAATSGTAGGIGALAGSAAGTRVVQVVAGNIVFSDDAGSPPGIWAVSGEPTSTAGSAVLITDLAGNPQDFAASPDTGSFPPSTSTVYVCDASPIANGGGIQRYDWNGSAYSLSYTLGTGTGSAAGASCLAVDFSANPTWGPGVTGAKIYATTAGNSGNSLLSIVDTGSNSTAIILETANPNQILRGVRFGPVEGPAIVVTNPQPQSAFVGGTAVFTVAAQNGPFAYQWQLNGTNLSNGLSVSGSGAVILGAQTATLTVTNIGAADDQESYTVVVSNPGPNSAVTNGTPAVLTVPVNITGFPTAFETVTNGGTASFTVIATGGAPLTYQWNGPCGTLSDGPANCNGSTAVIAGSSTATLTISNAGTADSGAYFVTVNNNESSTNTSSEPSVLDVYTGPPLIVSDIQPNSLVVPVGFKAVFSVTVAGSTPLVYQWLLNGAPLTDNGRVTGARTSVLTIANSQLSDSGNYQLFITNSAGTNYSSPASLTVTLIGFNNGGGWTDNGNASISSGSLSLTQGGTSENSSAFLTEPLDVAAFLATWTYQESPGAGAADGTAFVLQNAPAGTSALGGGGGDLGYVGMADSIAFEFNIYSPNAIGVAIGTNGLGKGGTTATGGGPYGPTGSVNIASGDPIGVTLEYLRGVASLTLTDSVAGVSFTTNFIVNVTNFVGSNTAYVGFTGAAGGVASSQTVIDFFFSSLPAVAVQNGAGGALVLTWPVGAPGFQLQETPSLSSPNWANVTNVPVVVNGQNQITIAPTGATEFYRLIIQ